MSNQISLILGVHNHQPVDNWDHVIEDAYAKCYKPFLDVLENHPGVGMSIHYTGYLLDWLFKHHPELIEQLKRLIQRGQVEMFGGAYYEPVIAIIPDSDKVGQIEKLSDRVEALTGQRPDGLWLAERVWEPHLVKPISQAGIRYLFLDDSHFRSAGLEPHELHGRYISEEQGHTVEIFPVDKTLRYQIPYTSPQEIINYLGTLTTPDGQRSAIYFDDGEKFGVWPGSYGLVYREKWLDRFFGLLEENAHFIQTVTPSQYVAKTSALGRIYLPTASYSEMMEWALPAKQLNGYLKGLKDAPEHHGQFFRAGFWRNFLVKYPEANNIHKKMLYVSEKIHRLQAKGLFDCSEALDELWKGQSNDVFWHGVFGGLYLTNLRSANYQHLLVAENLVDAQLYGKSFFHVETRDFDCDGQVELLVETSAQNLYMDPHEGGCLFELDYRAKNFNLLDTLARRYEPYHDRLGLPADDQQEVISKQQNLNQHLHYDWHRRVSMLDHFLGANTDLDMLAQSRHPEQGDFINQPYKAHVNGRVITLIRQGAVWAKVGSTDHHIPVQVQKRLTFPDSDQAKTVISYELTNLSTELIAPLWFAPEFNVNLLAGDAPDRFYYLPDDSSQPELPVAKGRKTLGNVAMAKHVALKPTLRSKKLISKEALRDVYGLGLRDEWMGIDYQLAWNKLGNVWRFPIETVSQSEAGFEKVYQSSAIFPNWKITLAPEESWHVEITQYISNP